MNVTETPSGQSKSDEIQHSPLVKQIWWNKLENWSRIAVLWWWPAWNFAAHEILRIWEEIWLKLIVHIFDPKYFLNKGPAWCNRCWWVISSKFVDNMRQSWIIIPDAIKRRPIESYILHSSWYSAKIKRDVTTNAFSVHRWWGPKCSVWWDDKSFDEYISKITRERWAIIISETVKGIIKDSNWKFNIITNLRWAEETAYDMVIPSFWVNSTLLKNNFFKNECNYIPPMTEKWNIIELNIWKDWVKNLKNIMHIFVTWIPEIKLSALVPKEDHATLILIWDNVNDQIKYNFLKLPEVLKLLPKKFDTEEHSGCFCRSNINIWAAQFDFRNAIAFTWDCLISRLYKDGIWTSFRMSKALAKTMLYDWIDANSLEHWEYWQTFKAQDKDNQMWVQIFKTLDIVRQIPLLRPFIVLWPKVLKKVLNIHWNLFSWDESYEHISTQISKWGIDIQDPNIENVVRTLHNISWIIWWAPWKSRKNLILASKVSI